MDPSRRDVLSEKDNGGAEWSDTCIEGPAGAAEVSLQKGDATKSSQVIHLSGKVQQVERDGVNAEDNSTELLVSTIGAR